MDYAKKLIAVDVWASGDDFAITAAMFCGVIFSRHGDAVDIDVTATGIDGIGIGAAAHGMDTRIIFAGGRKTVDEDIRRSIDNRTGTNMRANVAAMFVALNEGNIGKSCSWLHKILLYGDFIPHLNFKPCDNAQILCL